MAESVDLKPLQIDRGDALRARRRGGRRSALRSGSRWIVAALALAGLAWVFRAPLRARLDQWTLPGVKAIQVTRTSALAASAVAGTAANGYVVAAVRAALSADTPGRIVEMNVTEGSVVKKGDVVARLFSDEYRAALRQAEAELASARATVARSEAESRSAAAALEAARANVATLAARLAESSAARQLAALELARAKSLFEGDVGSRQLLDRATAEAGQADAAVRSAEGALDTAGKQVTEAEARLAAAQAAVAEDAARFPVLEAARDLAQATLDKTEVRAPFDGIVVLKDAEVGEVVSPNSQGGSSRGSVATMVDWKSLEVQIELPETSLAAARIGERTNVYLDAYPERLYTGEVRRIWPTANRQKATVEVRVGFDQPDERLRPEMGARVVFSPQGESAGAPAEPDAVLIPVGAVARIDGKDGVFVLERDVARWREVALGGQRSGRVKVASGLAGGERIVADPPSSLADGQRVRIQE